MKPHHSNDGPKLTLRSPDDRSLVADRLLIVELVPLQISHFRGTSAGVGQPWVEHWLVPVVASRAREQAFGWPRR